MKIAKFLEDCRCEFGHDTRLIPETEQFGLRADDSPYLKFRQVEAGIALFRAYGEKREREISETLAALKAAKAAKRAPARPKRAR